MAVKDGSGPRRQSILPNVAFWTAQKLRSFKPSICLPSCTASFQLACVLLQLAFVLHSSDHRTVPQGQTPWQWRTDRARGRQPILPNCLEVRFKRSICLLSCTASCQLPCLCLQLAFFLRWSGQGTVFLASNLLASYCSWLSSCTAPVKEPSRKAKTPWQSFLLPLAPLVPSSLMRSPCCRQGSAEIGDPFFSAKLWGPRESSKEKQHKSRVWELRSKMIESKWLKVTEGTREENRNRD